MGKGALLGCTNTIENKACRSIQAPAGGQVILALQVQIQKAACVKNFKGSFGDNNEETEGFFINRVADRGGDHSDHRSDRDSELAARSHRGE